MRISTKGSYAIAALVDLAIHANGAHVNLKNISERLDLSENYLRQLFMNLTKKGIVKSIRGAQGGYQLAMEPAQITIFKILESVEENLLLVPCIDEKLASQCDNYDQCSTRDTWIDIATIIYQGTQKKTLQQLIDGLERESDEN